MSGFRVLDFGELIHFCLVSGRIEHLRPHWLSTLRVAEVDIAGASKIPRQMQPDVQHVSVLNHPVEHEFETILCSPRKYACLLSSVFMLSKNFGAEQT